MLTRTTRKRASAVDRYKSFARLAKIESENLDYRVVIAKRPSVTAVIAPHGGRIEPGTSEIAAAIANNEHILYCFEGLKRRPHRDLHIQSTNFDEPKCLDLIERCSIVVAVHGLAGVDRRVDVGGRDIALRDKICASLNAAGFPSKVVTSGSHAAISRNNICNKGQREAGVQLEITKGLRGHLMRNKADLATFADSVLRAISAH